MAQKTLLRLEQKPLLTKDLSKDKGLVFQFKETNKEDRQESSLHNEDDNRDLSLTIQALLNASDSSFDDGSTGFRMGIDGVSSSGTVSKKKKYRKRPQSVNRRKQQEKKNQIQAKVIEEDVDNQVIKTKKRKVDEVGNVSAKSVKRDQSRVDPADPPTIQ